MTSKERVKAVFNHDIPDRVPKHEEFWADTIEKWHSQGMPRGIDIVDYFNLDISHTTGINQEIYPFRNEIIQENDEWIIEKNGYLETVKRWKHKTSSKEFIDNDIKDRRLWNELKGLLKPSEDRVDLAGIRRSIINYENMQKYNAFCIVGLWEQAKHILGFQNALENMAFDAEWVSDIFITFTDLILDCYRIIEDNNLKFDCIWIWDDLAYNKGMFFSPDMYRRILMPCYVKMFDYFHKRGMKIVFHCCGYVEKIIGLLKETGIDCLQALEAKTGIDLPKVKSTHRDLVFMGNIDCTVLITNDREKIEREIKYKMLNCKEGGNYIYHSDHSIPPEVDLKTMRYIFELVDFYGRY